MQSKHGFPVFKTFLEANHIKHVKELQLTEISE